MTVVVIFKLHIRRTHNLSTRIEWPLLSLFSNYAFDVHSFSMRTKWPSLSLFSNYAFDVHTVYQWGLNDRCSSHRCYHYFQTMHFTYTQCINEDWMTVIIVFKLRVWRTRRVSMRTDEWPLSFFQITHLTYTQFINEDYIDCCLLTNGRYKTKNHGRLLYLGKA